MRLGIGLGVCRGGAVAAATPLTILGASLSVWLRADASAITLDGSNVATWSDQSGNGRHATQATGAARPLYVASAASLNNQPAVYFGGEAAADYLTFSAFPAMTEADAWAVLVSDADPAGAVNDCGLWYLGTDVNSDTHPYVDGVIYEGAFSTARKTAGNPTPSLATKHFYLVRSKASAFSVEVNGGVLHGPVANTFAQTATPMLGRGANAVIFHKGHIAEFGICSTQMTAGQLAELEAYVTTRYAITMS